MGVRGALAVAIMICLLMAGYGWIRLHGIRPMPVQVRLAYLALLLLGTLPGCSWIHWMQLFGTSAMALAGYCPLVRMLKLLPWNRSVPLSRAFAKSLVLGPASGGLFYWSRAGTRVSAACSCSVTGLPLQARPS